MLHDALAKALCASFKIGALRIAFSYHTATRPLHLPIIVLNLAVLVGQQKKELRNRLLFCLYICKKSIMSDKRTELEELGEFRLIDTLTEKFKNHNNSTELGIGDDAAIISASENDAILVSTDSLIEGIHFNLMYTPLKHLGYKSVVVSISDICAMNAKPEQIMISLAVSNRFPLEALTELYEGVRLACEHYKVDLIGGDTTSSRSGLIITVTALGREKRRRSSSDPEPKRTIY